MRPNFLELERVVEEYEKTHPLTLEQKYRLLNALYLQARSFGHFTGEEALAGLEIDIQVAKTLNAKL